MNVINIIEKKNHVIKCVSFQCGENDSSVRMYGRCLGRRAMGESVALNNVMGVCGCIIELMCV